MSDMTSKKSGNYLEQFGDYLQSVGMAENTIQSYGRDVKQFLKFLEAEGGQRCVGYEAMSELERTAEAQNLPF